MVLAAIVIFPKRPLSVLDCLLTGQRLSIFVMIRSANVIASARRTPTLVTACHPLGQSPRRKNTRPSSTFPERVLPQEMSFCLSARRCHCGFLIRLPFTSTNE